MTFAEGHAGLDALPRRLDAAVRRVRAGHLLATLTTAVAVALVAFGLLEFATVFFRLDLDLADRCAIALILGLALAAVGTAADIFVWPGRITLARRADARLRLDERLSTAVEVAARGDDGAPVTRALLADAERRAGAIDPRALVTLPLARCGLILAAAAAFAAISLAPPDPLAGGTGRNGVTPSVTTLTAAEAGETGAELRRVATILERDAGARDDRFLEALAREAARIGEAIETGRLTDRDAVVAALDRLAGFTAEAYPALAGPAAASSFEDPLTAPDREAEATRMLRNLARERLATPAATPNGAAAEGQPMADPAATPPEAAPPATDIPPPTGDAPNSRTPGGEDAPQPAGGAPAPAPDQRHTGAAAMEIVDPMTFQAGSQAGERPEDAAPLGPADGANTGPSRFAGVGQQTLEGAPAPEQDPFALGADMFLTGQLDETGRRIRIEVPPEMQALVIDPGTATAMDWAPRREAEVLRTGVPLAARDLLARYFRAAAEAE